MKSNEYLDKLRKLGWLKSISGQYRDHLELIEKEKENYTIRGIGYTARSDDRVFNLNPHRPIPYKYLYDGLKETLDGINKEIEQMEKELKTVIVTL